MTFYKRLSAMRAGNPDRTFSVLQQSVNKSVVLNGLIIIINVINTLVLSGNARAKLLRELVFM